jgi:hypothetical protein
MPQGPAEESKGREWHDQARRSPTKKGSGPPRKYASMHEGETPKKRSPGHSRKIDSAPTPEYSDRAEHTWRMSETTSDSEKERNAREKAECKAFLRARSSDPERRRGSSTRLAFLSCRAASIIDVAQSIASLSFSICRKRSVYYILIIHSLRSAPEVWLVSDNQRPESLVTCSDGLSMAMLVCSNHANRSQIIRALPAYFFDALPDERKPAGDYSPNTRVDAMPPNQYLRFLPLIQ